MNLEWKNLIEKSLKPNQSFDDLIYRSHEGIDVSPFYDSNPIEIISQHPQEWRMVADFFPTKDWQIECLNLDFFDGKNFPQIGSKFFTNNLEIAKELKNQKKYFSFLFSPLTELAENGFWQTNKEQDVKNWSDLINDFRQNKSVCVDVSLFQNAGLKIFHQIAISLLIAKEYIELFGENVIPQLFLKTSVGGNFYFEIAKIKSMRFLFEKMYSDYGVNSNIEILARDSKRNKSFLDEENNAIRSTLNGLSAIFGVADYIWINPYNFLSSPEDFSSRELAYKQLLIFREESHLSKFQNPTHGAFFIENLQKEMIEKSWDIFLEWERKGGYLELLTKGFFADLAEQHHQEEQKLFDEKKLILIGINQYAGSSKKIKPHPIATSKKTTEFNPVKEKRLSETIENANESNI